MWSAWCACRASSRSHRWRASCNRRANDPAVADLADLDALVEIYRTYELATFPTVWQLRSHLRAALVDDVVVVAVDETGIVGAGELTNWTKRYVTLTNLVVDPRFRGRGLSWEIIMRTGQVAGDAGVGVVMALAPTNPMSFAHSRVTRSSESNEHQLSVALADRWPGQARLRARLSGLGPIEPRSAEPFRDYGDPDAKQG